MHDPRKDPMHDPRDTSPVLYRRVDLREAVKNPDLDLIGDYLTNDLPPAQVAAVRRRLEEDIYISIAHHSPA